MLGIPVGSVMAVLVLSAHGVAGPLEGSARGARALEPPSPSGPGPLFSSPHPAFVPNRLVWSPDRGRGSGSGPSGGPVRLSVRQEAGSGETIRTGGLVAAGTLGAFVGFFGGGWMGYELETGTEKGWHEYSGLAGAVIGAAAGSAVAIPVAVHLANRRRGSLLRSVGASAAVGGLGFLSPVTFFLAPLGMIAVSVRIEQSTGRSGGVSGGGEG